MAGCHIGVGGVVVDGFHDELASVVDAAPAAFFLGGSHTVVPSVDEGLGVLETGLDDPFTLEVDIAPVAGAGFLDRIEPVSQFGLFDAFLVIVPFLAGFGGLGREDEYGFGKESAILVDACPKTVLAFRGGKETGVVGETGDFEECGLDGPAAVGFDPTPEGGVGAHFGQSPSVDVAAMLNLGESVDAVFFVGEDKVADDIAIAVDIAPTATFKGLGVDVVVLAGELAYHGVLGLDYPAAKIVDDAPLVDILGVGDGDAPGVVVTAYNPLMSGFGGIFHAFEDVVDDEDAFGVDAAPAAFNFDGGKAHGVLAVVFAGTLVLGFVFPLPIVVDKAPLVVGRVLGGVDPFAGFFGGVPLVASLLGFLLGAEDVADNHVAGFIDAAPAAIVFYHGEFSVLMLESKGHLVARRYLPDAIAVFVAIFHANVVEG